MKCNYNVFHKLEIFTLNNVRIKNIYVLLLI